MADNKSREGNKCVRCDQLIMSTVRLDLNDHPSARIICDKCLSISPGELNLRIDVSDALKGLKAVQREAKKATAALKELEEVQGKFPMSIYEYEQRQRRCSGGYQ